MLDYKLEYHRRHCHSGWKKELHHRQKCVEKSSIRRIGLVVCGIIIVCAVASNDLWSLSLYCC